ncbi:MAG: hypothetical protein V3W34_05385 [Phycisphaerae bacterium]
MNLPTFNLRNVLFGARQLGRMRPVSRPTIFLLLAAALPFTAGGLVLGGGDVSQSDLSQTLVDYFNETDPSQRAKLVAAVESAAQGSFERVKGVLRELRLWSEVDGRESIIDLDTEPGHRTRLRVTTPKDYDVALPYPLILVIACSSSDEPGSLDQDWLDSLPPAFVVARVETAHCADFHTPPREAGSPRRWLRLLRRRFHLNADRTYLYGSGRNGDAAFMLALMYSDLFAGVIVREGTLDLPYRKELQQILLPNVRHTPVHLIWTRPDIPPDTLLKGRQIQVAVANQSIVKFAEREGLPITKTVLSESSSADPKAWVHMLELKREPLGSDVEHWFRFPAHGQARWLRQAGFAEPLWHGDQIDIQAQHAADQGAFINKVLRSKLVRLNGEIDGQSIIIHSSRCESVELLLNASTMDFSQPIHINYNGKRRFSGMVKPGIATLLESAYETWDFQHPAYVRLRIGKRGRVLPF